MEALGDYYPGDGVMMVMTGLLILRGVFTIGLIGALWRLATALARRVEREDR